MPPPPRETLTPAEVRALLKTVEDDPYWFAVLVLMTRTGLRSNEVRLLDRADLDTERRRLRVTGHSARVRFVAIGQKVVDALEAHLRTRPQPNAKAMFPTQTSARVSNRYLRTRIKRLGREAGIGRDLHPQALLPLINVDDPQVQAAVVIADEDETEVPSEDWLLQLVDTQRGLLISVATGGASPEQADDEYRSRQTEISEGLARIGLSNPFPWRSLWEWRTFYARRLGTHDERKADIDQRAREVLSKLGGEDGGSLASSSSWRLVDVRTRELRSRLREADSLDDYQDVGRRSREIIINAVNVVFTDGMVPRGQVVPQGSNAKARLEILADELLTGPSGRAELRTLLRDLGRSAWDLCQTVVHSSSASALDAFAAAHSTLLLVDLLKQLDQDHNRGRL